jgi:hypothetical protein
LAQQASSALLVCDPLHSAVTGWVFVGEGGAQSLSSVNAAYPLHFTDTASLLAAFPEGDMKDVLTELLKVNVAFASGGADSGAAPAALTPLYGASVNLPQKGDLVKSGYVFGGWNDGSVTYAAGAAYTVFGDVTFTAAWVDENDLITVTWANGGGTGTDPDLGFVYKSIPFTLPANPYTKTNYTFMWWNDGSADYAAGASYTTASGAVTFTAVWYKSVGSVADFIAMGGSSDSFVLTQDIDFTLETTFHGLTTFTGLFEGGGHKLSNITLTNSAVFGEMDADGGGGIVRNTIFVGIRAVSGADNAAVSTSNGRVSNCFIDITFESGAGGSGLINSFWRLESYAENCVVKISSPNNSTSADGVSAFCKTSYSGSVNNTLILAGSTNMHLWSGSSGNGGTWVNGKRLNGTEGEINTTYAGLFTDTASLLAAIPEGDMKTIVEDLLS